VKSPHIERAIALAAGLALACSAAAQFRSPRSVSAPKGSQGCAFDTLVPFYFGAYDDASSSPLQTTATFRIKCTGVGNASAVFSSGPSSVTGDYQDRRMQGPQGSQLRYQLYTNSARSIVWGDGTRDTQPIVVTQNGAYRDITVYAQMPASQAAEVGEYADTIVVTILP